MLVYSSNSFYFFFISLKFYSHLAAVQAAAILYICLQQNLETELFISNLEYNFLF